MGLCLTVEIVAGTPANVAAADLADLAERLGLIVEAKHAGIIMRALPDQTWNEVLRDYERECRLQNYPQS